MFPTSLQGYDAKVHWEWMDVRNATHPGLDDFMLQHFSFSHNEIY